MAKPPFNPRFPRQMACLLVLGLLLAGAPAVSPVPAATADRGAPILLKDINPGILPLGASPGELTVVGEQLMFFAEDRTHGSGLWSSDGTAEGTRYVWGHAHFDERWDVAFGTAVGNSLLFRFDDGIHGQELWRSDGTSAGTTLLRNIYPDDDSSVEPGTQASINRLYSTGERAYFVAYDGSGSWGLWTSTGTPESTLLLRPLTAYAGPLSEPSISMASAGEKLFFIWAGRNTLPELWVSDGTPAGTQLVKHISPDPANRVSIALGALGATALFNADDGVHGQELWRSDGTEQGTTLVTDLTPGPAGSRPQRFTLVGDRLYFLTEDAARGRRLWTSDGTATGTALVPVAPDEPDSFSLDSELTLLPGASSLILFETRWQTYSRLWGLRHDGTPLTPLRSFSYFPAYLSPAASVEGRLLFGVLNGAPEAGLWSTDGTVEGTQPLLLGASVRSMAGFTGRVFFPFEHPAYGEELWVSDGTRAGTQLFSDLNRAPAGAAPYCPVSANGLLFFSADDGVHGREPWVTDGTPEGTRLLGDLAPGPAHAHPCDFTPLGDSLVFSANDEAHGFELWVTDGTPEHTRLLIDIVPGATGSWPHSFVRVGESLVFVADNKLWRTDGSAADTRPITTPEQPDGVGASSVLTLAGNVLFFTKTEAGASPTIWAIRTEFRQARLVYHVVPSYRATPALSYTGLHDWLLFGVNDCCGPNPVGASDGTPEGTRLLTQSGAFVPLDERRALFIGYDSLDLWVTEGPPASTVQLYSAPGERGLRSTVTSHSAAGRVYFSWPDRSGTELMVSDGTSEGTRSLGRLDGTVNQVQAYASGAFFSITGLSSYGAVQAELWHTDGTPEGTGAVYSYRGASWNGVPKIFALRGKRLLFSTEDEAHGNELWASDGSRAGTVLCRDLNPGPGSSWPQFFGTAAGPAERIIFTREDERYGLELWSLPSSALCSHGLFLPSVATQR